MKNNLQVSVFVYYSPCIPLVSSHPLEGPRAGNCFMTRDVYPLLNCKVVLKDRLNVYEQEPFAPHLL